MAQGGVQGGVRSCNPTVLAEFLHLPADRSIMDPKQIRYLFHPCRFPRLTTWSRPPAYSILDGLVMNSKYQVK